MIQKQITKSESLPPISLGYAREYKFPSLDLQSYTQVLTDAGAYKLAKDYLRSRKKLGQKSFSILDLTCDLGLPLEQANKVIEQLQFENRISEE